jgi:hypothetical protein
VPKRVVRPRQNRNPNQIEPEHLDETLDLSRLADVACMSPYHFHRIYHGMQGETVADTVRRLSLHRAAVELIAGDLPVSRIARLPVTAARKPSPERSKPPMACRRRTTVPRSVPHRPHAEQRT